MYVARGRRWNSRQGPHLDSAMDSCRNHPHPSRTLSLCVHRGSLPATQASRRQWEDLRENSGKSFGQDKYLSF